MGQNILSSIGQLIDFKENSIVWKDIKNELHVWLEDIRDLLENPDGDMSVRVLDRLGGNAETLRNILALPEVLIDILEGQKNK